MGVKATDMKYKASGPLADIIGTRSMKRGAIIKKIWVYIRKEDLQGVSGSGDTVKYKGKTYKGGQIIYCGDDPAFKKLCKNKKKISMVQIPVYMEPHLNLQ